MPAPSRTCPRFSQATKDRDVRSREACPVQQFVDGTTMVVKNDVRARKDPECGCVFISQFKYSLSNDAAVPLETWALLCVVHGGPIVKKQLQS